MAKIHIKKKWQEMAKIHYKSDPWVKYLFFKVNNTIMREFTILFIENILKQLPKKIG